MLARWQRTARDRNRSGLQVLPRPCFCERQRRRPFAGAGSEKSALGLTVAFVLHGAQMRRPSATRRVHGDRDRGRALRGRRAGGLTNHWSCAVPRFSAEDFDDAKRAGESTAWPLDMTICPCRSVEPLLHIARGWLCAVAAGSADNSSLADWAPIAAETHHSAGRSRRCHTLRSRNDSDVQRHSVQFVRRLIKPELRSEGWRFASMRASCAWIGRTTNARAAVVFRDARTGSKPSRMQCVVPCGGRDRTRRSCSRRRAPSFEVSATRTRARTLPARPPARKISLIWNSDLNPPASYFTRSDARPRAPALRCRVHAMEWTETLARSLLQRRPARCRGSLQRVRTMRPSVTIGAWIRPARRERAQQSAPYPASARAEKRWTRLATTSSMP